MRERQGKGHPHVATFLAWGFGGQWERTGSQLPFLHQEVHRPGKGFEVPKALHALEAEFTCGLNPACSLLFQFSL